MMSWAFVEESEDLEDVSEPAVDEEEVLWELARWGLRLSFVSSEAGTL